MKRLRIGSVVLVVLPALWSATALGVPGSAEPETTRVSPESVPFSVGYIQYVTVPDGCSIVDGENEAMFGYNVGASYRAWVVWQLDSIPIDADIEMIEVEHFVWPSGDPFHRTQYRYLEDQPTGATDCELLWEALDGPIYTDYFTGGGEGWRRQTLGGTARDDFESRLAGDGWFGVAITAAFDATGAASTTGWSQGGPDLIVTWTPGTPVDHSTWGRVKSVSRGRSN